MPCVGQEMSQVWKIKAFQYRSRDREDSQDRDQQRSSHRGDRDPTESQGKRRSRSRCRRLYDTEEFEDRSRIQSAHSIELNSFQDHLHGSHSSELHESHSSDLHESHLSELHGSHSFQDHVENNDFVRKTFHTIYRSKSVDSINNETDPEGKTKILMILDIKLPHCKGTDNLKVKVDDGAEANIFPSKSFRTMSKATQRQDS